MRLTVCIKQQKKKKKIAVRRNNWPISTVRRKKKATVSQVHGSRYIYVKETAGNGDKKKKQDEKLIKKRRIQYFVSEMDVVRLFRVDPL